jgi:hypothetical protein
MWRERALKVVLVLPGLLFSAGVYPLMVFVRQDPALAMMMSLYVTLGGYGAPISSRINHVENVRHSYS